MVAERERFIGLEGFDDWAEFVTASAVEAFRVGRIAVEFDHFIVGDARGLVETVDVLGDHVGDFAGLRKRRDDAVATIGCGRSDSLFGADLSAPGFATHLFRGEEVVEHNRLILVPDPAGAPEIRNAGFSAYARAGEDDGLSGLIDYSSKFMLKHRKIVPISTRTG